MQLNEYQKMAMRTSNGKPGEENEDQIDNGLMGLNGEAGECIDIWKKYRHQGHPLDTEKLIDELGDVLWYIAETASGMNVTLEGIAMHNIAKLRERYPNGFDPEKSMNRN